MVFYKLSLLCLATVFVASTSAGYLSAPAVYGHAGYGYGHPGLAYGHPGSVAIASPAVTTQQANILRSYGNLGQVSTFSKTIDTPYSSVSKSDIRVSNPGVAVASYGHYAPAIAHGPAYATAYAPALARPALGYAGYAGYARPAVAAVPHAAGLLGVAYSPATAVSHMTYSAPALGLSYAW